VSFVLSVLLVTLGTHHSIDVEAIGGLLRLTSKILESILRLVTPITDALSEVINDIVDAVTNGRPLTEDLVARLLAALHINSIRDLDLSVRIQLGIYLNLTA
ncbi:hypothetical protein QWY28_23430, partial [Nocardioides sp. SOB77]